MCELCNLEKKTKWHYEGWIFIIVDCKSCGILMLVFKSHGPRTKEEHRKARETIISLYGKRLIKIRTKPKKILDHEHWHIMLEEQP